MNTYNRTVTIPAAQDVDATMSDGKLRVQEVPVIPEQGTSSQEITPDMTEATFESGRLVVKATLPDGRILRSNE